MAIIPAHYHKAKQKAFFTFFKRDRYLIKTPGWLKLFYPSCVWNMTKEPKTLYITFDDGPHPTITPFVLDQLKKHNAMATFFCIGDNVLKYPEIYQRIIDHGHAVGNHTQNHIDGWKTDEETYIKNITAAEKHISSKLFRPPYGRIKKSQLKLLHLQKPDIKVIMWNILAGDWDATLPPQRCFERIKRKISDGDIIVFHDSDKAAERMQVAFPKVLEYYSSLGYRFKKI